MNCAHCHNEMNFHVQIVKYGEVTHMCEDCFEDLLDDLESDYEDDQHIDVMNLY